MQRLLNQLNVYSYPLSRATWRSGDAADCKSAYPGSIPGVASTFFLFVSAYQAVPAILCKGVTALLYARIHHGMPRIVPR